LTDLEPVGLSQEFAALIILVFVAGYAIHWLRRAFRQPSPTTPQTPSRIPGESVNYFDVIQRLFHWSDLLVLGVMILTGVTIFIPGQFDFLVAPFGVTGMSAKIFLHVTFVWALLVLIVIHVLWDTLIARGFGNIWIGENDFNNSMIRAKNFLGLSKEYPREAKYDIFMKAFHWGLTGSLMVLGVTGLFFWNPFGLMPNLPYTTAFIFRTLHDLFAFLLTGLIIGHIYFAILPVNWPVLRAMVTGNVSKEFYLEHQDASRWHTTIRTRTSQRVRR
jgi:cytochrome b subunit of formate dehydrogenase